MWRATEHYGKTRTLTKNTKAAKKRAERAKHKAGRKLKKRK
jgi:hypothetical protein